MGETDASAPDRLHPRLELPEADFVALKVYAARRRMTLRRLLETTIADWLARHVSPPTDPASLAEPVVRVTVSLPADLHTQLKVRAAYARTTMQVLMRAALAPLIEAERDQGGAQL